jgi:hypothetical protein
MHLKIGKSANPAPANPAQGGLAGWLLSRWRNRARTEPRLVLLERITLAPRQTLCLVEAEGRRFLVANSPEGAPAFYPLLGKGSPSARDSTRDSGRRRVSW